MRRFISFTEWKQVSGHRQKHGAGAPVNPLSPRRGAEETAGALAAYITGVAASNLAGRLVSATAAELLGLGANFYLFAALNLAGAALVFVTLDRMPPPAAVPGRLQPPLASWGEHLSNPALRASFGVGFLILFAFIGTFTYVNFVLAGEPIAGGRG